MLVLNARYIFRNKLDLMSANAGWNTYDISNGAPVLVYGVDRPYKQAEFEIIFGEGVSKLGCVLDCAELIEVVSKKGSWYNYGEHRLGQGREKALQFLRENPLLAEEIEKMVRSSVLEATGFVGSSSLKHQLPQLLEEHALQEMQ